MFKEIQRKAGAATLVVAIAAIAGALGVIVSTPNQADAARQDKVTICHRNNAVNNRYNLITVDISAINGSKQSDHAHHQGPVAVNQAAAQVLKNQGTKWGDIIPPFTTSGTPTGYPAYNWDVIGQAVWANGCNEPKAASATISITPATCEVGEILVYGAISRATFSGTANGTTGPAPYNVTATANTDALFGNTTNIKQWSGTLAAHTPAQSTNPEGLCYVKPETMQAIATIATEPATCELGEKLVYGNIENATFSGTADGTYGPGVYDVTATAAEGAAFAGDTTSRHWEGTLAGVIPTQSTDPEGDCYKAPETPGTPTTPTTPQTPATPVAAPSAKAIEALPYTGSNATPIVIAGASLIAGVAFAIARALRMRSLNQL